MKVNGNELRPGNVIEHKDRLWVVTKTSHVKPGKGPAYLQAELKDIQDGTKLNERFRASETVERARLDEIDHQFLFADGDQYTFMNAENYEQIILGGDIIGDQIAFLDDGMTVTIDLHEGTPVGVHLPDSVVLEVVEADAVVKGQTAASSYKPAVMENGVRVMVPPHITSGTRIVVKVEDASYVERAKD